MTSRSIRAAVIALVFAALGGCGPPNDHTISQTTPDPVREQINVTGVVTDDGGARVENAYVAVVCGSRLSNTFSGVSGAFTTSVLANTTYECGQLTVSVSRAGYDLQQQRFPVVAAGPRSFSLDVRLPSRMESLVIGALMSNQVDVGLPQGYLGVPYDSDYSTAYRSFRLSAMPSANVVVELRWTDPTELELWLTNGLDVSKATVVADGVKSLVVPSGRTGTIVVGTPGSAPVNSVPFTLSATIR